MRKIILLFILISVLHFPLTGYGQYSFFEHTYKYKLEDVLDADDFVEKDDYWEGYRDDELVGYAFLSDRWTEKLVGYSGKHMKTLVGMDTNGLLTGIKLLFHSEPIVLIGLKEKNYQNFLRQYAGNDINRKMKVGEEISMDAITGATVTAIVQNAIIFGSARKVAARAGMMKYEKKEKHRISGIYEKVTWKELLDTGAVKNLKVRSSDLGINEKGLYMDLYFGVVTPPSIGRNILGDAAYGELMDVLKQEDTALFIVSRGEGSFKGSGFARGGIFDRVNVEQNARVYVFRDKDYRIITDVPLKGAPDIREGGIFVVRGDDFDPAAGFTLNLMLPYRVGSKKEFNSYSLEYRLPGMFLE